MVVEEFRTPPRPSYPRVELGGEGEVGELWRAQETRFGTASVKRPIDEGNYRVKPDEKTGLEKIRRRIRRSGAPSPSASSHRLKLTPGRRRSTSPSIGSAGNKSSAGSRTSTRSPPNNPRMLQRGSRSPPRSCIRAHRFGRSCSAGSPRPVNGAGVAAVRAPPATASPGSWRTSHWAGDRPRWR